MVDAALIQQCADKALKPEIVEMFIERAGSQDPLAITVRSGNRIVLVPKLATANEALVLIRDNLGRNTVRVGITQYPAGLGIIEAGQLRPEIVDACENIRIGTALFGKVYRIVTRWYGNPTNKEVLPQVFDDAIIAWQTGYFEGVAVFQAPNAEETRPVEPASLDIVDRNQGPSGDRTASSYADLQLMRTHPTRTRRVSAWICRRMVPDSPENRGKDRTAHQLHGLCTGKTGIRPL